MGRNGGETWTETSTEPERGIALWFFVALTLGLGFIVLGLRRSNELSEDSTLPKTTSGIDSALGGLLISDLPLSDPSQDRLGHSKIAHGLSHFISNPHTEARMTMVVIGA